MLNGTKEQEHDKRCLERTKGYEGFYENIAYSAVTAIERCENSKSNPKSIENQRRITIVNPAPLFFKLPRDLCLRLPRPHIIKAVNRLPNHNSHVIIIRRDPIQYRKKRKHT